jgi:hypothetical protein
MARREYIQHPQLVQIREGFSLLDLKRYVEAHGFKGEGLGQLDFDDLVENAPIMVPVDALGYNHFVIFRGVMGDRVLLADPAWGNRTMTIDKFKRMWLDYGKRMGHVGFVVKRRWGCTGEPDAAAAERVRDVRLRSRRRSTVGGKKRGRALGNSTACAVIAIAGTVLLVDRPAIRLLSAVRLCPQDAIRQELQYSSV